MPEKAVNKVKRKYAILIADGSRPKKSAIPPHTPAMIRLSDLTSFLLSTFISFVSLIFAKIQKKAIFAFNLTKTANCHLSLI